MFYGNINRKIAITIAGILFTASAVFAKTDGVTLNATGYEWLGFSPEEKQVFAGLLHIATGEKKEAYNNEEVIKKLDDFYYGAIENAKKDPLNFDENESLNVKCISVIKEAG